MRVLTVGNLYPPHDLGGGYEFVWRAAVGALTARAHTVRVLATDHRIPGRGPDEGDVHRELRWYWDDHHFPERPFRADLATERHNTAVLERHLAAFRPDVVAWWAMGGLSLSLLETCRRAGVPAVAFVHDDWLDYGPRADGWQRRFAGRPRTARAAERVTGVPTVLRLADAAHYAFCSLTTRDHAWMAGAATPDRSVISPGIDGRFLDPAPARAWEHSLLYVSRVDARKGIATALGALALLPEATLTVAGSGSPEALAAMHERAAALGVTDRLDVVPARGFAAVSALYEAADAVLFPVEWREPWGLVPLEAMGRGRPVIATGRGGSGEYLRDGENALLFAPGDAGALAARVRRLADDAELRTRLRDGGIRTAALHTADAYNAAIEAVLARRVAGRAPVPAPPAASPPSVAVVADGDWRSADADVVLFLDPGAEPTGELIAAHAEAHRRRPGDEHAIQGALDLPRDAFTRWLAHRGHPPLGPAPPGEIGPARLDLRNASFKRTLLERAGGPTPGCLAGLELAHRLSDRGLRLHHEPRARAQITRPVRLADVRERVPAALAAERDLIRAHPQLEPSLRARLAHAAERGPVRGRLGRALVARVSERAPLIGSAIWRNASDHYEGQLARADLESSD